MDDERHQDVLALVLSRLDSMERRQLARAAERERQHLETQRILRSIETEAKCTNGRITRAELAIKWLRGQMKDIDRRIAARVGGVTRKDVATAVAIIAAVWLILTQVLGFHR